MTVGEVTGSLVLVGAQHLAVDRVLEAQQLRAGEMAVVGLHGFLGRLEIHHSGVVGGNRLGLDAAQHGCTSALVHVGVGVVADDVLVAPLAVRQQPAQVRLGAARHIQGRRLAEQVGGVALELIDGGVVAPDVVADLGRGHRGTHAGRRTGNGVGAQVDHGAKPAMQLARCNERV